MFFVKVSYYHNIAPMKIFRHISSLIQSILAPSRCVVCWSHWPYLCLFHETYLLWYPTCCWYCGKPTSYTQNCSEHQSYNTTWLSGLIVWFYYTRIIKHLIHKAKYWWAYHLLSYLAKKLSLLVHVHITDRYPDIIITYIPMHPKKEFYQRWYNQSQKLAEYIALELNALCIPLLTKTISTKAQMKKNRKDRQKLTSTIYDIIPTNISPTTLIVLVDDIVTTWSTFQSASAVIKQHFPDNIIRWICVARNT